MTITKSILAAAFLHLLVSLPVYAQTSFAPLVRQIMPSAVNISVRLPENADGPDIVNNLLFTSPDGHSALGAGFIVDERGFIATNRHVVEQGETVSVSTYDDVVYEAQVFGVDFKTDIALLKINPERSLQAVKYGDSDKVEVGDRMIAVGNPFGLGSSVSAGIISAKSRVIGDGQYDDYLQTDAAINQGNSGGPMFNLSGELIGMNTAIFSRDGIGAGVSFAVPSNQVKWVVDQLINKKKVERGWLGVFVKAGHSDDGLSGLVVTSYGSDKRVADDSILQPGDLILDMNGEPVPDVRAFSLKIAELPVGTELEFKIRRNGEIITKKVLTGLMPDERIGDNPEKHKTADADMMYSGYGIALHGLRISAVQPGSEAARKGVKEGDEIVKVGGNAALDAENLRYYFRDAMHSGEPLRLDIHGGDGNSYFVELNSAAETKETENYAD